MSKGLRPEIQALRAIAVGLVVVHHLWPATLPGGFIGVDVFFAISGFLITSLLLREIDRTGRVSLTGFWARRARRILPAALVTVLFCAVATILVVPLNSWEHFLTELRTSTAYVQNWQLAASAVDYFAQSEAPSPVQHFWSLSVEEQFYLVWPLLLMLALSICRGRRRWAIGIAMGALTVLSFAYSVHETAANPAAAYFVTPTRAWEFGAGGLLALLLPQIDRSPCAVRSVISWAGIAAIVLAALTYTSKISFPGYAALLPVLGALAVMCAGAPARRWSPTPVLTLPPVQFVGDISYSVYLWHWPLIVLAPFVVNGVHTQTRITILMLTLLAAWLTKLLIEDPVRAGAFLTRRKARWTYGAAAMGTALVMGVTAGCTTHVQAEMHKAELVSARVLAAKPSCFGAAARDPEHPCSDRKLRYRVVPTPAVARNKPNAPCRIIEKRSVQVCAFGVSEKRATGTIALVGDSHASHWRAALQVVARRKRWRGLSLTHTSCPFSRAIRKLVEPDRSRCIRWRSELVGWFRRHPEVSTVFVSQLSGGTGIETKARDKFGAEMAGYVGAWKSLPASVEHIVVIRDTPNVGGATDVCVERAIARHQRAGVVCAVTRSRALNRDAAATAAARMKTPRVQVVDLTRFLCDRGPCYPVIGGALVYKDANHLTTVFGTTLGPYLERLLDRLMEGWET
jgi:peptidoglycan/LPS O-acetylase OafA/YrhL